jgi:hypothetical protein
VIHAHGLWRPLETLTDEEVQLLDSITKKLNAPAAADASQDGPHNQIESKPAALPETATLGAKETEEHVL